MIKNTLSKISIKYGRIDSAINNVRVNNGASLYDFIEDFVNSLKPMFKIALTGQGETSGYVAAKGGVMGLTREWAVDLIGFGIRFNTFIIAESCTPAYDT